MLQQPRPSGSRRIGVIRLSPTGSGRPATTKGEIMATLAEQVARFLRVAQEYINAAGFYLYEAIFGGSSGIESNARLSGAPPGGLMPELFTHSLRTERGVYDLVDPDVLAAKTRAKSGAKTGIPEPPAFPVKTITKAESYDLARAELAEAGNALAEALAQQGHRAAAEDVMSLVEVVKRDDFREFDTRWPAIQARVKVAAIATPPGTLTATTDKREAMAGAANESVDAKGEVTNPRDPTAYVLASVARLEHTPAGLLTNHKQLVAVLSGHPEIKRWHPRKNRLCVHLADWTAFVKKKTEQRDAEGLLTNPDEIAARTAEVRRKKSSGK